MAQPPIRCTLHWLERGQPRRQDLLLSDRPFGELLPLLVELVALPMQPPADSGSDLPVATATLELRPGPQAPAWPLERTPSALGLRDGGHLWLLPVVSLPPSQPPALYSAASSTRLEPPPCILLLPGGRRVTMPADGQPITRDWLLEQLSRPRALLETLRFRLGRSPYQVVAARAPHCALRPSLHGWQLETERADVETWLNGVPVCPGQPCMLSAGDRIQPGGARGPELVVAALGA